MNDFIHKHFDKLFSLSLLLMIVSFAYSCYDAETSEQKESKKQYYEKGCHSKKSGSSPRCWTDADWSAYCERVSCK